MTNNISSLPMLKALILIMVIKYIHVLVIDFIILIIPGHILTGLS